MQLQNMHYVAIMHNMRIIGILRRLLAAVRRVYDQSIFTEFGD